MQAKFSHTYYLLLSELALALPITMFGLPVSVLILISLDVLCYVIYDLDI